MDHPSCPTCGHKLASFKDYPVLQIVGVDLVSIDPGANYATVKGRSEALYEYQRPTTIMLPIEVAAHFINHPDSGPFAHSDGYVYWIDQGLAKAHTKGGLFFEELPGKNRRSVIVRALNRKEQLVGLTGNLALQGYLRIIISALAKHIKPETLKPGWPVHGDASNPDIYTFKVPDTDILISLQDHEQSNQDFRSIDLVAWRSDGHIHPFFDGERMDILGTIAQIRYRGILL